MRVTIASPKAIRYACHNFHYAKSVPSVQYGFNIYNDADEWCGVVCFGGGASPNLGKPYELYHGEVLELVRVALNGKQHTTSQCVAACMRELHRINPLVRLLVSFADIDQGHTGTIYQATNWLYEGVTYHRRYAGDAGFAAVYRTDSAAAGPYDVARGCAVGKRQGFL